MRFVTNWALQNHPVSELVIADGVSVKGDKHQLVVNAHGAGLAADLSNPMMLDRVGKLFKNVDRVKIACPHERKENWSLIVKGAGVTGTVRVDRGAVPLIIEQVEILGESDA